MGQTVLFISADIRKIMCNQLSVVFVVGLLADQVINLSGPRERPVQLVS